MDLIVYENVRHKVVFHEIAESQNKLPATVY